MGTLQIIQRDASDLDEICLSYIIRIMSICTILNYKKMRRSMSCVQYKHKEK